MTDREKLLAWADFIDREFASIDADELFGGFLNGTDDLRAIADRLERLAKLEARVKALEKFQNKRLADKIHECEHEWGTVGQAEAVLRALREAGDE